MSVLHSRSVSFEGPPVMFLAFPDVRKFAHKWGRIKTKFGASVM